MAFLTDRKRASGLGSAKEGTHHFWSMQVSSYALVLLTPLFLFSFGGILGAEHDAVLAHFARPWPALITALMLIVGFQHFRMGVQVLIEDYAEGLTRKWLIIAMIIVSYGAMATGLFAIATAGTLIELSSEATQRMAAYDVTHHEYDVVVIGAGGSGLRATLGMAEQGLKTACVSKVFPTRSHTVAAQGGIAASLGNMGPDSWQWHMYDTVKGSDWLGDVDAMEYLAREAPKAVYELEHYGVPFSRTEEGKIYQRPFGGHTTEFGEGPPGAAHLCRRRPHRPRHPAHALRPKPEEQRRVLHRVFRHRPDHVRRRSVSGRALPGSLTTARMHVFNAKMVVLATGGYGRAYFSATSAHTCTGDGGGMVARAGPAACRTWSSCSSTPPASTARAA